MATMKRGSRDKVRTHRQRMRACGLSPIPIRVAYTRTATFRAEARRQSLAVAQSAHARDGVLTSRRPSRGARLQDDTVRSGPRAPERSVPTSRMLWPLPVSSAILPVCER